MRHLKCRSLLGERGVCSSFANYETSLYTEIAVTLENSIQLVSLDGLATTNAKFAAGTDDFVFRVKNTVVDATASGQLVLDFNLANFTYSSTTGLVVPEVVLPKPEEAFKKFVRQQAEVKGVVMSTSVDAATITLVNPRFPNGVVVSLTSDAVITNEETGVVLTLANITAGSRLEVKGAVVPGATAADPATIQASLVHVEPIGSQPLPPAVAKLHGEGVISAVNGNVVTVSLKEANFLPGSNVVRINVANASFPHGMLADAAVGVEVRFRGDVATLAETTSGTVNAVVFDIKGAPSKARRDAAPEVRFAEAHGLISSVNSDGTYRVLVLPKNDDRPNVAPGTYDFDISKAVFDEGSAKCAVAGVELEVRGEVKDHAIKAGTAKIRGCSGQRRAASAAAKPRQD